MRKEFVILLGVAALAGCGQADEKKFNESFNTKFRESCVGSATKSGAPADIATKICDCTIGKIDAKYSAMERLTASEEELMPLMNECVNSVVPK